MNDIYICLDHCSGFGDAYANFLTGYIAYNDLIRMGYKVKVMLSVYNRYFSSDILLDIFYDFSSFNCDVEQIKKIDEQKFASEYSLLQQDRNIIRIWVRNDIFNELKFYQQVPYDRYGLLNITQDVDFKNQFLSKEILNIAESYIKNYKNIIGIHFRCLDINVNSTVDEIWNIDSYKHELKIYEDLITNNKDENIMMCTNNNNIKKYFNERYDNVFVNNFSYSLPHLFTNNDTSTDIKRIIHAKETLAEMAGFAECVKIYTSITNMSNFLLYGMVHNKHKNDLKSKIKILNY